MNYLLPVILCGGSGTRLWPLSRQFYPKQMLQLAGSYTMLQTTAMRVNQQCLPEGWQLKSPLVVGQEDCRFLTAEQLHQIGLKSAHIILEPIGRNTAPALTLAALNATADGSDPIMIVMPADHIIKDEKSFQSALMQALPLAESGIVVAFGVTPSSAEVGYGYLRCGARMPDSDASELTAFVEKPDHATAKAYLADGHYLWNSGIYLLRASVWLQQIERFRPDILLACEAATAESSTDDNFIRIERNAFVDCASESIDYAVMEPLALTDRQHKLCAVYPLEAGWSDVGAWNALMDIGEKDNQGNVVSGDVLAVGSQNTLIRAENRLVVSLGLRDTIVVETADVVLVAHRDQLHLIKEALTELKTAGRTECDMHRKVQRPWGYYDGIDEGHRFQVKRIVVSVGACLSLQMHHHRAEHWVVVKGTARVTRGAEQFLLTENQSTYIPLGVVHRLENPGLVPLEIIEIQSGAYLGEDDIVRFEDNYSRDALAQVKPSSVIESPLSVQTKTIEAPIAM